MKIDFEHRSNLYFLL